MPASDLRPWIDLQHREGIVNAIALRLSNVRLEAMNSSVRLISYCSRGDYDR